MRTLLGWIIGVFALGLVAGSLYRSTSAESEPDRASLDTVLRSTPAVDCGAGREAVLAPLAGANGTTVQIKCVPTSAARERVASATVTRAPTAAAPTPAPAPAPVVVTTSREQPAASTSTSTSGDTGQVDRKTTRSAKDAALIIGGSAGAGAGIGAIAKGKKGAAVGAAIGGVAGTVYHILTRNPKEN